LPLAWNVSICLSLQTYLHICECCVVPVSTDHPHPQ
jgi:hypothetical protein